MCSPVSPYLQGALERLGLPERFNQTLISYVARLVGRLEPQCVVLYGSLAKGTYTTASDIDLVVVSRLLPDSFHERLTCLQDLNDTRRAIDDFAYTPEGFQRMLTRGHVTALDAVADGVAVHWEAYFAELRQLFQAMVQRGLHRSPCSWVLPSSA